MDIGTRIRDARKAAGMSQDGLARRAAMSLNGLAQLERGGRTDPHYSTLEKLAGALGMSVGGLLEGTTTMGSSSPPKTEAPTEPAEAPKIKIGRKNMTPDEVKEEVKRLKEEAKELEAQKKGAETAQKILQEQIEVRIAGAEEAFRKETAALKAKYGDDHTLEFMDVPDKEWIALLREAEDVRVEDAGKLVTDLYMGFSERMAEFMPGEGAQGALRMNQSEKISEALRFMERWIAGVVEEMEDEDSVARKRGQ